MLVPRPTTDGEAQTVGQHSGLVDLRECEISMNGVKSIAAANCQESSIISGLCPNHHHPQSAHCWSNAGSLTVPDERGGCLLRCEKSELYGEGAVLAPLVC